MIYYFTCEYLPTSLMLCHEIHEAPLPFQIEFQS